MCSFAGHNFSFGLTYTTTFKVTASQSMATDDDHIAELLAKEAKEASKKYSALGIRALLPTR
jgi:hypothetical protein